MCVFAFDSDQKGLGERYVESIVGFDRQTGAVSVGKIGTYVSIAFPRQGVGGR